MDTPNACLRYFLLAVLLNTFKVSYAQTIKSKVFCEGSKARLRCKKSQVIFMYTAEYGWANDELPLCGVKKQTANNCEKKQDVSDVVSKVCADKQRCLFRVSPKKFNYPCGKGNRHRLRVFFSCVPKPEKPTTTESTPTTMRESTTIKPQTKPRENRHDIDTLELKTTTIAPRSINGTDTNTTGDILVWDDPEAAYSPDSSYAFGILSSLITCFYFAIGSGRQGVLLTFVCSAAGGTIIMLFLMLAMTMMTHRSGEFSMESSMNEDYHKTEEVEVRNGTLRPRLPPQESVEEPQQEELEAKQISTPGTKHHLDEEFGYIADDIMRYYSSRNIGNDSQKSIRKMSMSYDEPELISMANEAPETMQENKYNSFNRFSDSKEVDYDELMEQLNAISYQFTLSDLAYDELENAYVS